MLDYLIDLDTRLFLFLNGIHSEFWDKVMWFISGKYEWLPFYVILLGILIYKFKWKAVGVFIGVVLVITMADQSSVKLFKFVFERLRPCHNPDIQSLVHTVNGKCGGQFGFVSSHAANSFGLAMYLTLLFKNKYFTWFIFFWAALVAYSRVYLGVHYPADITGGALLGMLCGYVGYKLYQLYERWYDTRYAS